jgi:DNA replication protein DnaC
VLPRFAAARESLVSATRELHPERLTGALLDRLTHHVHILEMNGDSYHLKQSKQRQRRT